MSQLLLEGPATEPLSLAEARQWLRVEHTQDDDLIGALIVSARLLVEQTTRRLLLSQRWRVIHEIASPIHIRLHPLISVDEVRIRPRTGAAIILGAADFTVTAEAEISHVCVNAWPSGVQPDARVEIDVTVGYGNAASAVPAPLRQAMRMLAARWYEQRGDASAPASAQTLPPDVAALLAPYRHVRLA